MDWHAWLAKWGILVLELLLSFAITCLALLSRRGESCRSRLTFFDRHFSSLARNKGLSVAAVGFLCLGLRLALLPVLGIPQPSVHDEFGYLLAADTFAHGRLTNPTHPMWVHFETFHVIQQPTYMAIYPPGQGAVLALGKKLGHPWIGVVLSTSLLCAAICWMLQAWVPPKWALFGGLLAVVRLGLFSYWMNSYWGGAPAALGGALLLGALPRLRRKACTRDGLLMAASLAILANTRPYEGLILSLPVAAMLVIWIARQRHSRAKIVLRRAVVPITLSMLVVFLAIGYYNFRVTGSAWRTPYRIEEISYRSVPPFLWQKAWAPPTYHHDVLRRYFEEQVQQYETCRTASGFWQHSEDVLIIGWVFFVGPGLTLCLFALPAVVVRDRRLKGTVLIAAVFVPGLLAETWMLPHYFAPATGLFYLILVQCFRHVRQWKWRGRRVGTALVQGTVFVCCAMAVLRITAILTGIQIEPARAHWSLERAELLRKFQSSSMNHLVIVRYGPQHNLGQEWIYNVADIDRAKVVWARDMGAMQNRELLEYYRDRKAWILYADDKPPHLQALP